MRELAYPAICTSKLLMTLDPQTSRSHLGFRSFARWVSSAAGRPSAFALSVAVVVLWAISGPFFHFSDTWQLVINTGTTVVTFWMVFVIQSSQNNDTQALQLKLDELIRATDAARNVFLGCEGLPEEDFSAFQTEFNALQKRARARAAEKSRQIDRQSL